MALGDGDTWDETNPTNSTLATLIDDYDRDLRKGVRSRMNREHEWPASQAATSEGGQHRFITLQNQSTKPTLAGTQTSAVYTKTIGTTGNALFFQNSAGVETQIINSAGTGLRAGHVVQVVQTTLTSSTQASGYTAFSSTSQPTTNQGFLLMSRTITPTATSSVLLIDYEVYYDVNGVFAAGVYFLGDAGVRNVTKEILAASLSNGGHKGSHMDTAGTTGEITVRLLVDAGSSTININNNTYGGKIGTLLRVTEFSPLQ